MSDVGIAVPTAPSPPVERRFLNRELSWLEFNARVLALAEDRSVPLLERVKFLAIFGTNLDEFFQVRVAGLKYRVAGGLGPTGADGLAPRPLLLAIRRRVDQLLDRQAALYAEDIVPALAEAGITCSTWADLATEDRRELTAIFEERIFPVLTPLSVDPAHPFPRISDLSLNLAVTLRDPLDGIRRFARVKLPPFLPRFLPLGDGGRFVALEEVVAAHLEVLFPGIEVEEHFVFRVTRNSDLTVPESEDLLAAVEMELRRRRFRSAVRLEVEAGAPLEAHSLLVEELELEPEDIYEAVVPIDLGGLHSIVRLDRPDLKDEPWAPVPCRALAEAEAAGTSYFAALRRGDVLVHHPYESFRSSVEEFIRRAARDPDVLAIKQTLYRTSGDSPIVQALVRAAHAGKQVVVLVELQARFDEAANVRWARALEDAGAHVVYGVLGLKTHCKLALVVRQEDDGIRRYCHVGTGNYNSTTAQTYEDLGLLSADPPLGAEASHLFNFLTGYGRQGDHSRLLVAPEGLRPRLLELIEGEARPGGRIVVKANHLSDPEIIEALYAASGAGASIDLIIRTVCCLVPGVPGLSENVRVRSLLGRFLEHSRVFAFGDGSQAPIAYFMGSGDLMPRNLDERVEAFVTVEDPELRARLGAFLAINLDDGAAHWRLGPDGSWHRSGGWSTQERFHALISASAPQVRPGPLAPPVGFDVDPTLEGGLAGA